jgi:MFS family permease
MGPLISGFGATLGWRWPFWIALIGAGVSFLLLLLLPETYAPVILKSRAARMRKENGGDVCAPTKLEKKRLKQIVTLILFRPLHMLIFEPVVLWVCVYLALTFAILYLFFEAYPIVFQGMLSK